MRFAAYNGFPFHFELLGHVLEYCKRGVDVFSGTEGSMGWFDYYDICPRPISEFNPDEYDFIFLLTDDDWSFPNVDPSKVICIDHYYSVRRPGPYRRVSLCQRSDPSPVISSTFTIPRLPKRSKVTVCMVGAGKHDRIKYTDVDFVCIGRGFNPVSTSEMLHVMSVSHYCLFMGYDFRRIGTSGCIPMALMCGCLILTTKDVIDFYQLDSMIDYDSIDRLEIPGPERVERVYTEHRKLVDERNMIYDSIISSSGSGKINLPPDSK